MVNSALRRLRMTRLNSDVVLGGGVARWRGTRLIDHIQEGVRALSPAARVHVLDAPPVLGAAFLGLDEIGATRRAYAEVRSAVTHDRLTSPGRER